MTQSTHFYFYFPFPCSPYIPLVPFSLFWVTFTNSHLQELNCNKSFVRYHPLERFPNKCTGTRRSINSFLASRLSSCPCIYLENKTAEYDLKNVSKLSTTS